MLYNAKNGAVPIDNAIMDYITFGSGGRNLIIIPGLGDGFQTVKGLALPFAFMYRKLAKDYTVYVFSRRRDLPQGFTTKDMARDIALAMRKLGMERASVVGVSQGGMIAQFLAIDFPKAVEKLVLVVTLARQNETVQTVIGNWVELANQGDYKGIMVDTAEKSYSEKYLKKSRWMYSLLGGVGKPKSFTRFLRMADACLTHDAYEVLHNMTCPTLILGGAEDKIVSAEASKELAAQISGSTLYLYEGLGHGLYEEAKDFLERVMEFIK